MTSFALEMPIVQIRSEIARKKVNVVQNDKFLLIHQFSGEQKNKRIEEKEMSKNGISKDFYILTK